MVTRFQRFRELSILACTLLLLAMAAGAEAQPGGGGGLSQASLDLDTAECPTTFTPPICQEQTEWSLEKDVLNPLPGDGLENPEGDPFSFKVTVTEGPTQTVLKGGGEIVITNSGEFSAVLSSILVNLEIPVTDGSGDAPGPSGQNFLILATALANESGDCSRRSGAPY